MLQNPNLTITNKKPQIDPNRKKWRLRVGVVWCEARRHIEDFDITVLVLLWFGDQRFLCRLAAAPVHRRPPPRACVAGPCETSSPVARLMGAVVLHYRQRNNNGSRRRGGGHERVTLAPAGLCALRGVRGEAAGASCANHVADGGSVAVSRT